MKKKTILKEWDERGILGKAEFLLALLGVIGLLLGAIGIIKINYNSYSFGNSTNPQINNAGNQSIENNQFTISNNTISNDSNFIFASNMVNSPISLVTNKVYSDNCGGNAYSQILQLNMTDFFSNFSLCGIETTNMISKPKYDLYNVEVKLPSKQSIYLKQVRAGEKYNIAYVNSDSSDACIPSMYKLPDFNASELCFTLVEQGGTLCSIETVNLIPGPLFKSNKSQCYKQIAGDVDIFEGWNPS